MTAIGVPVLLILHRGKGKAEKVIQLNLINLYLIFLYDYYFCCFPFFLEPFKDNWQFTVPSTKDSSFKISSLVEISPIKILSVAHQRQRWELFLIFFQWYFHFKFGYMKIWLKSNGCKQSVKIQEHDTIAHTTKYMAILTSQWSSYLCEILFLHTFNMKS